MKTQNNALNVELKNKCRYEHWDMLNHFVRQVIQFR
jgi:hypothetical protein